MEETKNPYILQSVETALDVLELFMDNEELSSNEVAKQLGISNSSAFRALATLESKKFLQKDAYAKFRLSLKVYALGQMAYKRMDLASLARPELVKLSQFCNETVHLAVWDGLANTIFIDRVIGKTFLQMNSTLGATQNLYVTATGKAILAYQSKETIDRYLSELTIVSHTPHTIKTKKALIHVLDQIREKGYACDNQEAEIGLTCYAVPIISAAGEAIAAISISGPSSRMVPCKEKYIIKLKEAASIIEGLMQ